MKVKQITIYTTSEASELVADILFDIGCEGVSIYDSADFATLLSSDVIWDYVDENLEASMHGKSRVTFYLPADETGFAQMGEVRLALEDLKARRSD